MHLSEHKQLQLLSPVVGSIMIHLGTERRNKASESTKLTILCKSKEFFVIISGFISQSAVRILQRFRLLESQWVWIWLFGIIAESGPQKSDGKSLDFAIFS